MATVGSIVVNLVAKTSAFLEGMKKATKGTTKFSTSIESMSKKVLKFGAAAATAAAGGLALIVNSSLAAIDSVAKVSDKLGIAIEDLIGLRHAAVLSGVGVSTLDMALQRMTRRVAEAANGMGEAKAAIKELGLDAVELSAIGPGKAFNMIADAMSNVVGEGNKLRLAFKLFDSEGAALVNTLRGGSAALLEMKNETILFGATITRQAAAKVELANDAISRMKLALSGLAQTLTIEASPAIARAANSISEFIVSTRKLIPEISKTAALAAGMTVAFAGGVLAVTSLIKIVPILIKSLKALTKAQSVALSIVGPKGWAQLAAGILAAAAAGIAIDQTFRKFETDARGSTTAVVELSTGVDGLTLSMDKLASSSTDALSSLSGLSQEYLNGIKKSKNYESVIVGLQSSILEFGLEGAELLKSQLTRQGFSGEEIDFAVREASKLDALRAKAKADDKDPNITQFNKSLVSFQAGTDAQKRTVKGDPQQTQLLAQIAINTKSPTGVLGR